MRNHAVKKQDFIAELNKDFGDFKYLFVSFKYNIYFIIDPIGNRTYHCQDSPIFAKYSKIPGIKDFICIAEKDIILL